MTTPAQLRAGRALAGLTAEDVAGRAGVSAAVLARAEGEGPAAPSDAVDAICRALAASGVVFLPSDGEGPGVRLRKTTHDEGIRLDQLTTENDH